MKYYFSKLRNMTFGLEWIPSSLSFPTGSYVTELCALARNARTVLFNQCVASNARGKAPRSLNIDTAGPTGFDDLYISAQSCPPQNVIGRQPRIVGCCVLRAVSVSAAVLRDVASACDARIAVLCPNKNLAIALHCYAHVGACYVTRRRGHQIPSGL